MVLDREERSIGETDKSERGVEDILVMCAVTQERTASLTLPLNFHPSFVV